MPRNLLALLLAGLFAIAGCGDDDDDEESASGGTTTAAESSSADQADVEAALTAYFGGTTSREICGAITRGLQSALAGRGPVAQPADPATKKCEADIEAAEADGKFSLEPAEPEIEEVAVSGRLAAARILNETTQPDPYPVFLVKTDDKWLVHAEFHAPPEGGGFDALEEQVAE